jgi:hypothetical protein
MNALKPRTAGDQSTPSNSRGLENGAATNDFLTLDSGLSKPAARIVSGRQNRVSRRKICALYLHMQDLVLATIGLAGCAFLIYVFFHWLREGLNSKPPLKLKRRSISPDSHRPQQRPFVVPPQRHRT